MWLKPPFFLLIWFAVVTAILAYRLYRIWFYTDDEYENMVQKARRFSPWHPFKKYWIVSLEDKETWVSNSKILGTVVFMLLIGMDILVITAFLIGK
jgi:hypothetical protein